MQHLQIAIGIVRSTQQEIFITQRVNHSHMAGSWEFPGGKIEQNETPLAALKRELLEEIGITVQQASLFKTLQHHYTDRALTLHFYLVKRWQNEPFGREGQPTRWVHQSELRSTEFPPANGEIIEMLTQPFCD
ncbi:8-oxo-dGTP diphosphatase MutT [Candidatus Fukatsuia symbiotica]|uniref:8-oxo-dGTP diphosphatase n=1 Tax=Candidatus Fukatsuia symbiotica TaxID=1878942 RepID=A0A2U8I4X5_9GAMM|nr:8-oxo-dGTP diphosphatase MutT [Candidatus Fukatsuia symbiotica]AWK14197.1 8-oxo-dGTP diphosphatase MutT [Candidatus Fukatsuia symbiotica]MEA9446300.1 8-oxo-dGTP diphosphatase MutT [Candidatus Fukatsuia symbiotica]